MIAPKILLQVEIFCNQVIEDYEETRFSDFETGQRKADDASHGWYECGQAILRLIEEKRRILWVKYQEK